MAEYQEWEADPTTGANVGRSGDGNYREAAEQVKEEAKRRGKGIVEDQKLSVSNSFGRFATTLKKAAGELEDQPLFARLLRGASDALENVSRKMRERDAGTLLQEAQDFARREPVLTVAGTIAVGFILSRLFKSSPR